MQITTIGIDLAKNVFQVHGVSATGKVLLRKQLRRKDMEKFFRNLPPCLIGMEACGGAHYWARTFTVQGHTVKLMPPQYVKPYVKTNKSDLRDAEAICEAVSRPTMRFVPVKSPDQQAILSLHRVREGLIKTRTALGNQLRGLLAEFGIVIPQGLSKLLTQLPLLLDEKRSELPEVFVRLLERQLKTLRETDQQVKELQDEINNLHRQNPASRKLEEIPGIGPLSASALFATIGFGGEFHNGRQVAAWLGLVPRQHSTGGKTSLGRISKRGDIYLRTLLIHGARSVTKHAELKEDEWVGKLVKRRNKNIAAVALANKNARIAWAILHNNREYDPNYSNKGKATTSSTETTKVS